jgi:hypothetical protein
MKSKQPVSVFIESAGDPPSCESVSTLRERKGSVSAKACWDASTHTMRNELYLRSRTGVRASFIAPTFAEGSESSSSRQTEGKLS